MEGSNELEEYDVWFEKLEVWQKAVDLADSVYEATTAFPNDERFGLTNQMRRAAVSISSNVAEGSSRSSKRDFARFVEIAYGSLREVVSQAHVSRRRGFVVNDGFERLVNDSETLARMLSGLRSSLLRSAG